MYIRKSIRSYKGKTYTNYVLVESVVTPNGPRQKTICSLGDLSPRPREGWLELALKIEDALVGQDNLVGSDDSEVAEIVGRVRARRTKEARAQAEPSASLPRTRGGALIKVDPSRVTTEQHREAGPVHVGYQFWQRLGLDHILRDCGLSAGGCPLRLRDDAQSVDCARLRARHAGLDPAHGARRHSRRQLRCAGGRPALSGPRQAVSAPHRHRGCADRARAQLVQSRSNDLSLRPHLNVF